MNLTISPTSPVPIYRQLVDQIRLLVLGGQLVPGRQMPGSRELAETLQINLHTVGKAYQELVRSGLLEMRRGAGAFVAAAVPDQFERARSEALEPGLKRLCHEARLLGLPLEELQQALRDRWNDEEQS